MKAYSRRKPVLSSTASYARDSNKVMQFIEEALIEDPQEEIRTSLVYEAYRAWCARNGLFPENNRNFNQGTSESGKGHKETP